MVKTIPMEDWLRGCVYHDGRHGEVTLPTDKVLEIANYIQLTRTSQTDGCIELPPYTADTPQTEKTCDNCGTPRDKCVYCIEEDRMWTPQTDCSEKPNNCETCRHKHDGTIGYCKTCGESNYEPKDEPQAECEITDCDYHDACKKRGQTDCQWK